MVTATSERAQAPARQGYFVGTTELPKIQTVTVWTPCCAPMSTPPIRKTEWNVSVAVSPETVGVSKTNISDGTMLEKGLYLLYIAIYMYNLMLYPDKNVW